MKGILPWWEVVRPATPVRRARPPSLTAEVDCAREERFPDDRLADDGPFLGDDLSVV